MSLQIENLTVYYQTLRGDVQALEDATFTIADGEIMGLAGESGCGKTTLGHSLIRLTPPMRYVKGRVALDGEAYLDPDQFDFDGDLYGQHLRVALVDYLRPEMAFDGVEALKQQMAEDCKRARATLAYEEWDAAWPASPFMAAPVDISDLRED